MISRYQKRRLAKLRWSKNAVQAKARLLENRQNAPVETYQPSSDKAPKIRFDLKVNLERRDGGKLQFTLHHFYGKLIGQNINMSPKQFGRKLGEIFEVWMME